MNRREKEEYLAKYAEQKKRGIPFFPDALFKDVIIMLVIFLALVALSYFIGAELGPRANPADTSYTPRPEWYFLFLFQLLKYFPGSLEFLGVVVLPTVAIATLAALPFLDRSAKRHPSSRKWVVAVTGLLGAGFVVLTALAIASQPPPAAATTTGDQAAALYVANCAGCHGPAIDVPAGTDLHEVISQGNHDGMPAWNGDLSAEEIDALAGYISSPNGHAVFQSECAACHQVTDLTAVSPFQLRAAIEQEPSFTGHENVDVPDWRTTLSKNAQTTLLNFLVAPDGQRLYTENCSSCHGTAPVFSGSKDELRAIITTGGKHREMPQWAGKLSDDQIDELARYVVDPSSEPGGEALFGEHCATCHGSRIPKADDVESARTTIAEGGAHVTMPVWGDVLTADQLDALVAYTYDATQGTGLAKGQQLFEANCAPCHGQFGEGGPLPTNPARILAPISTAEFLSTRDDATLKSIISHGQPNLGMSPFAITNGGPLSDDDIDALVRLMRSWQTNPPVEFPPEVVAPPPLGGDHATVYAALCSQCHGENGEGGIGPSFQGPEFQAQSDAQIYTSIHDGHPATPMIAWGELLPSSTINDLVKQLRGFATEGGTPPEASPYDAVDAIFRAKCVVCHGIQGNWDATSYESAMSTGDHAPVVIPGDPDGSLLVQKINGTQTEGLAMPPFGSLTDEEIATIVDWVQNGAQK